MRRRILTSALAITAAVLTAAGVHAYATYARWASNTATFYVNPANADVSAPPRSAALEAGMNVWNTQGDSGFQLPVRRHGVRHLDTRTTTGTW